MTEVSFLTLNNVKYYTDGTFFIKKVDIELSDGIVVTHILHGDEFLMPVCIIADHKAKAITMRYYNDDEICLSFITGKLMKEKLEELLEKVIQKVEEATKRENPIWQSDWNGYEVGYPDIPVVGLYSFADGSSAYINTENGEILERWKEED